GIADEKTQRELLVMHSRIVAAVATTSIQRQPPRKLRTRVTSASCRLRMPACGSSNSIRLGGAAAVSDAESDIIYPRRWCAPSTPSAQQHGYWSKPFGMLALVSAAGRAFIHPSRCAFSSAGGLDLPYSAHAAASTSWRLIRPLL